jgi:phenylpropionate dioxygenase-like ring-hydroxylating dioxygenase large terminal subunit
MDPMTTSLTQLIDERLPGFALAQPFYTDPEIYQRELERFLLPHWLCVGHQSQIPNEGDYFLFEIASESVIVQRRQQGEIGALANVCRHRGSRVCYEGHGNAKTLVCPYHGWSYQLDGQLRSARHTGDGFEKGRFGLKSVHCRVIHGLIFVCLADEALKLNDVESSAARVFGPYGWADARVAHSESWTIEANWKLAVENYLECFHCGPAHPAYAKLHSNQQPYWKNEQRRTDLEASARAMGIEIPSEDRWASDAQPGEESILSHRAAMYAGCVTGSEDGRPVAPLMGHFPEYDGGATFCHIGPASYFLAYADYGVIYRFTPRDVQKTEMEVIWLVRGDTQEGVDYELDRLSWMWQVTSAEDKLIIDQNQAGINSRFYRPGPYTLVEANTQRFVEWVLAAIA